MSEPGELSPSRSRLLVGLLVLVVGLIIAVPNILPLVSYYRASMGEAVTARWDGSQTVTSSRDTVGVPSFVYQRRIGPIVQDCRISLLRYRHAPDGKPLHETLRLVPGRTCEDATVLDDPPRERIPLAVLGILTLIGGAVLTWVAARRAG